MLEPGTVLDIGDHTVEVLDTPAATGDRYRVRIEAQPGAPGIKGDFPHSHPAVAETFRCVAGHMTARLGRAVRTVEPGQQIQASPGVVHGFVNTGSDSLVVDSEVIFVDGYRPDRDLLIFGSIYDRLRRERKDRGEEPEPPFLQMAVLAHAHRNVIRQPGIVGLLLPPLAAFGRLWGYRPETIDAQE